MTDIEIKVGDTVRRIGTEPVQWRRVAKIEDCMFLFADGSTGHRDEYRFAHRPSETRKPAYPTDPWLQAHPDADTADRSMPAGEALAVREAARDALDEAERAVRRWPTFPTAHHGFAVLLEEVDELKAHVWTNQRRRDLAAMRAEAIQVAAMALRFAATVCDEERGRR